MKSRATVPPFFFAFLLALAAQPFCNIVKVTAWHAGIVHLDPSRFRVSSLRSGLATSIAWFRRLFTVRQLATIGALLAAALAMHLIHPDAAHGAPLFLIGMAGPVMPGPNGGSAPHVFGAYLGRNAGPEFFSSITHNGTAQQVLIPKNLSLNRPLEAIMFRWRGRVDISVANYTAAAAESPQTLINRIKIQGTYKGTALTPVSLTGATAYAWARLFGIRGSSSYIGTTRQAEPTSPFGQTLANLGNIGTYDLDIWYIVPTWPVVSGANRSRSQVPYLWQPADWADSLQITLELGDRTSLGTPAGGSVATFTAFGSAAGSPTVEIYTRYQILGAIRGGFHTACVVRNENTITAGVASIASNVRVMPMQKQKTTNLLVKSGVNLTGVSSGVQVFASLNDTTLERSQILVDNKPIRNNLSNLASKESIGYQFTTIEPQGYLPFSFIDGQSPRAAFRADLPTVVGSGSDFALYSDIIAANANTQLNVVQEMLFADADDPFWLGTR